MFSKYVDINKNRCEAMSTSTILMTVVTTVTTVGYGGVKSVTGCPTLSQALTWDTDHNCNIKSGHMQHCHSPSWDEVVTNLGGTNLGQLFLVGLNLGQTWDLQHVTTWEKS
jgi:hypothetical protein